LNVYPYSPTDLLMSSLHRLMKKEETNKQVIDQIIDIQDDPDTNYGYRKMYFALMMLGYYINHKKVYRLMKEHNLLK